MKRYFFFACLIAIAILSIATNWYTSLSVSLTAVLLVMLIDKMGKGIILRETIAFIYVFTCLLMPLLGYEYYGINNALSKLWVTYMSVPKDTYFSFALPALSLFCVAIMMPVSRKSDAEQGEGAKRLIAQVKDILSTHKNPGLIIVSVGLIVSLGISYLPDFLQFFATLLFFGSFSGLLYIYYAKGFPHKKLLITLFALFIAYNAISVGMFTIVAYMGITIFSFLMLGKKASLFRKLAIFVLASFFFIVLQNVKLAYRNYVWRSHFTGSQIGLFSGLFVDYLQKGDELFGKKAFFPIYTRTNQGYNVALVMRRIPASHPFDKGDRLVTVFASAFVPRFLWPDKPEAGGKFNMKYYAGFDINGWSTNVGPLGEAYGSFGRFGGIIYMCFMGIFLRWAYFRIFALARRIPLIICWLPMLFYQVTSSAETDTLEVINSLIKSAFFIWLLIKLFPSWFAIVRKEVVKKRRPVKPAVA